MRADLNFDDDDEEDVSYKAPFLTDDNFEEKINSSDVLMLYFHAPWCNHCKKFTPQYNKAAEYLLNLEIENVELVQVDTTLNPKPSKKYNVDGFPTVLWFQYGQHIEYKGPRTSEAIIEYARKKKNQTSWSKEITCEEITTRHPGELHLVFVGDKYADEGKQWKAEFRKVSEDLIN